MSRAVTIKAPFLAPASVKAWARVRCCGNKLHRIVLTTRGRLCLLDHTPEMEAAYSLAGIDTATCHCRRVLDAWREVCTHRVMCFSRKRYGRTSFGGDSPRKVIPDALWPIATKHAETHTARAKRSAADESDRREQLRPVFGLEASRIADRKRAVVKRRAAALGVDTAFAYGSFVPALDDVRGRMADTSHVSFTNVARAIRLRDPEALAVDCRGRRLVLRDSKWVILEGESR